MKISVEHKVILSLYILRNLCFYIYQKINHNSVKAYSNNSNRLTSAICAFNNVPYCYLNKGVMNNTLK